MTEATFDPSGPAPKDSGVFGLPYTEQESQVVFLPVPWEATTSYGGGTARGPEAILRASHQVDLYDLDVLTPYQSKLHMRALPAEVLAWNEEGKALAQKVITGEVTGASEIDAILNKVNALSAKVNAFVHDATQSVLGQGKLVGLVGGDHSVPFGALQAIAQREESFGILHFDAHSDTRDAYEGFQFSHASIMHNVLTQIPQVSRLVQVGIRDVCEQEVQFVASQGKRVRVFHDRDLAHAKHEGIPFRHVAERIASTLPDRVWVSFDIDGLDPRFCPHTGTPVPGGLEMREAVTILRALVLAKKTIIGFDLNEVSPNLADEDDEWDANVGARLLYKMTGFMLASHGKTRLLPPGDIIV
jgi:agmatinase